MAEQRGFRFVDRCDILSLDGLGLSHYGDCALVLRESMIAHRASVFEENSSIFARRWGYEALPPGYRAVWKNRGRVAVAKLADGIEVSSSEKDFPNLLLRCGAVPGEDHFVEVKEIVLFDTSPSAKTLLLAFEHDLAKASVELRILS
jgi:hypothetical protein